MIFDAGNPVAIIDWEMASLGGAHLDIGWWLMTDLVQHPDGLRAARRARDAQ